jgi:transcriptional regulator with XRE-family HTH domain
MRVHIGKAIKQQIEELGMSKAEFARRMNRSPQAVQWWFQKESIDTALLEQVSEVLHRNMFTCYVREEDFLLIKSGGAVSAVEFGADLSKELDDCKKENAYLKEINELLRKEGKK